MIEISYSDSLGLPDTIYIDVRSPGEFEHDRIPGSINMPVFDDNERSEIGTIYRHAGREEAIIKGTAIVGGKIGNMVSEILKHKMKNIIILCFRGGMRSGAVAAVADSLGIRVFKLKDGYRGYRRYITGRLNEIEETPEFIIIQGLTGTGKTEIIRKISNSLDLEEMAGHRSSIFGSIGLKPNSQKKFESLIVKKIEGLINAKFILIEGESKKLGNLHIPANFYDKMCRSRIILITASMERRIDVIINEYGKFQENNQIIQIVKSLKMKLGNSMVDHLISLYNENNIRKFTEILLEHYYDPLYKHKLDNMKYLMEIENINIENTIKKIEKNLETM